MFENPLAQCVVNTVYTDVSAGAIVRDLIRQAQERGIAVSCDTVDDGQMVKSMVFNYTRIDEALASVAESTGGDLRYCINYQMGGPVTKFAVAFTAA